MTGVAAEVGSTANNYQILARLATGGMAEIFLARGTSTTGVERYVVLKRILRERAADGQLVKMFLDEARLAAQLQHPNVAQVYDIGKLGDSYFFTMEYVHGETVRALLHRARSLRREIPPNVILTVIMGAAAGLHHAHERLGHDGKPLGIVHRDVSPSNLMVSYEGAVKVVDFGVAKAENRAQETRSGTVKGKIAYLSPEQCRGGALDRRSDLFSLGIVMWEMLTVERLYKRASDFENMTAIVTEEPPLPSSRRAGISPELDRIAMRLLSKDPNQRYQTADELVEAIEEAAPRLGAMVSTSSVGRLLRDMFGTRPEPWLELDVQAAQQDPNVMAAGEPVSRELVAPAGQSIDNMLAHVRDLSQRMPTEAGPPADPMQGPRSQVLTAQAIPAQIPQSELPTLLGTAPPTSPYPMVQANYQSAPHHAIQEPSRSTGSVPPLDSQPRAFPIPQSQPLRQMRETFSPTGSSSGEHAYPSTGAGSSSGVHAYPSGSHANYPVLVSERPQPVASRRWPLLAIIVVAALLGSLTVWLVMRGGGDNATPDGAVVAIADAGGASPDNVVVVEPTDAAAVKTEDAAVKTEDAAIATVEDAATKVEDAAVMPAQDPLLVAFEEGKFSDVVAECSRTFRAEQAPTCVLAACKTSQDARAQKWYPRVAASARRQIANACKELGVEVTPKVVRPPNAKPDAGVVDPCAANPMSCQR